MSIQAAEAGTMKQATEMYAAYDGEWVNVPLGGGDEGWTRPADWLPTTVVAGEQKVQILVAVSGTSDTERSYAFQQSVSSSGTCTVDWGDGSAPEVVASGVVAKHLYDYAALAGTETSEGWRQALVTITPQAGRTLLSTTVNSVYATGQWRSNLAEVVFGPSTSQIVFTSGPLAPMLQRIEMLSPMTLSSGTNLFFACQALREIAGQLTITGTSAAQMFQTCYFLEKFPTLITPALTTATAMFNNCYAMKEVPDFDWTNVTLWNNAFDGCRSLVALPEGFSAAKATTCTSMFANCTLLEEAHVPTPLSTNVQSMFSGCFALRAVTVDFASATIVSNALSTCYRLESITDLDVGAATTVGNIVVNDYRLTRLAFRAGKAPKVSFSVTGTNLDAAALNAIYTALPTVTGQTVTVTNVPGAATDDPTIATAKGWTVTG